MASQNQGLSPVPEVGQVWRGINPRHGAAGVEDATIIKLNDKIRKHIILRFKSGGEHGVLPEQLGPQNGWTFVSGGN
ncbi:MAG: hypothetical protein HY985_03045 [Magnetospirillum sp.]|nr:hypothetical protein [Magnetospirillum sp.]